LGTKIHHFATSLNSISLLQKSTFVLLLKITKFFRSHRPVSRTTGPGRVLAVVSSIEARLPGGARRARRYESSNNGGTLMKVWGYHRLLVGGDWNHGIL